MGIEQASARESRKNRAAAADGPPARTTGESRSRATPLLGTALEASITPSDDDADPLIGQTPLGQYRIVQKIGEGGFGAVYVAEQVEVGRKAVIKVMRPRLGASDIFIKRFRREATVLAALDHHHLVRLYNFGELENGQLFLAMEYGGDRTLADEIRLNGRLTPERALLITEQVCEALQEAHSRGVVHRDLKPANILLSRKDGRDWVKVVDVGIAKILEGGIDDGQSRLTDSDIIAGTPAYLSPEQANGKPLDGRSDLYAMGCVLYEMLSGRLPFEAQTPLEFIKAHGLLPPISLGSRGIVTSPAIQALVRRALEKEPAKRFQSATEMAAACAAARMIKTSRSRWLLWLAGGVAVAVATAAAFASLVDSRNARGTEIASAGVAVSETPKAPPVVKISMTPAVRAEPIVKAPEPPVGPPAATPAKESPGRSRHLKKSGQIAEATTVVVNAQTAEVNADTAVVKAWTARIENAAGLDRERRFSESIPIYKQMLAEHPPQAALPSIYLGLANAYYANGNSPDALTYYELYQPSVPPQSAAALAKKIASLRDELGMK
jgi:serine/threonine-protein kinase